MISKKLSFSKKEKLKSKKTIESIFQRGRKFKSYPCFFFYVTCGDPIQFSSQYNLFPFLLGVSCPKRKFKTAVQRNRIKRIMRESYRLNKPAIYDLPSQTYLLSEAISCMMVYVGNEDPTFEILEKSTIKFLEHLRKSYS